MQSIRAQASASKAQRSTLALQSIEKFLRCLPSCKAGARPA